jgi:hypothetical protein
MHSYPTTMHPSAVVNFGDVQGHPLPTWVSRQHRMEYRE